MLASIDYYGLAAVIAALTGLVTAIATAFAHRTATKTQRIAADTNTKVTTANGMSVAEILDKSNLAADALENEKANNPQT